MIWDSIKVIIIILLLLLLLLNVKNKLLTYPLSYSSLQEEAVSKENSNHIKHSLQKKQKQKQRNDRM